MLLVFILMVLVLVVVLLFIAAVMNRAQGVTGRGSTKTGCSFVHSQYSSHKH